MRRIAADWSCGRVLVFAGIAAGPSKGDADETCDRKSRYVIHHACFHAVDHGEISCANKQHYSMVCKSQRLHGYALTGMRPRVRLTTNVPRRTMMKNQAKPKLHTTPRQ